MLEKLGSLNDFAAQRGLAANSPEALDAYTHALTGERQATATTLGLSLNQLHELRIGEMRLPLSPDVVEVPADLAAAS